MVICVIDPAEERSWGGRVNAAHKGRLTVLRDQKVPRLCYLGKI